MIPLRDENPSRSIPVVTYLLIAANVAAYLWEIASPHRRLIHYLMIPAILTGAAVPPPGFTLDPPIETIFTSMFLHGGFLHIAGNMLYLWIFGDNVEDLLGPIRFLIFYLSCGLVAAIAQISMAPDSVVPTLGASGAIAGVLGAYLINYGSASVLCILTLGIFWQTVWMPAWLVLGGWFLIQLVDQTVLRPGANGGGVAYMAHIGGFVAGMFMVFLLGGRSHRRAPVDRTGWSGWQ